MVDAHIRSGELDWSQHRHEGSQPLPDDRDVIARVMGGVTDGLVRSLRDVSGGQVDSLQYARGSSGVPHLTREQIDAVEAILKDQIFKETASFAKDLRDAQHEIDNLRSNREQEIREAIRGTKERVATPDEDDDNGRLRRFGAATLTAIAISSGLGGVVASAYTEVDDHAQRVVDNTIEGAERFWRTVTFAKGARDTVGDVRDTVDDVLGLGLEDSAVMSGDEGEIK